MSVLFLCTGNSARSIMAEAIANGRYGETLTAQSAGSHPRSEVWPLALETLRRHGVETAGLRSKSWHEVAGETFDLVVTVCDRARAEQCPTFPRTPSRAHWNLPDPPEAAVPADAFESVYQALDDSLGRLAEEHAG